jgi:hypothetical protein
MSTLSLPPLCSPISRLYHIILHPLDQQPSVCGTESTCVCIILIIIIDNTCVCGEPPEVAPSPGEDDPPAAHSYYYGYNQ